MVQRVQPNAEAEAALLRVSRDPLTGLPNRALLGDRLTVALAQAARHNELVALVIIDLNKSVEARAALGLERSELLTQMVADHLQLFARRSDTFAHIGSDLFGIVMARVRSLPQILGLTTRLMKLFDGPWELDGQSLHLAPGVGVAYYPKNGTESDELLASAVAAAGKASRGDTSRPHLADPHWHAQARERLALEVDLRRALEQEELLLHYQPQVSAIDGCVSGFEALARWQHPERGLMMPNDFIPLAEDTHLIAPIGTWVIDEACRQMAAWRDRGLPGMRVAVNLAAEQLADEHLLDQVAESLRRYDLPASLLEIEITESTAFANEARTAAVLRPWVPSAYASPSTTSAPATRRHSRCASTGSTH